MTSTSGKLCAFLGLVSRIRLPLCHDNSPPSTQILLFFTPRSFTNDEPSQDERFGPVLTPDGDPLDSQKLRHYRKYVIDVSQDGEMQFSFFGFCFPRFFSFFQQILLLVLHCFCGASKQHSETKMECKHAVWQNKMFGTASSLTLPPSSLPDSLQSKSSLLTMMMAPCTTTAWP